MTKNSLFLLIAFMGTLCNSVIFSSEKRILTSDERRLEFQECKLKTTKDQVKRIS